MSVNLHQTLYRTSDALNVHTRAIELAGENVANANNENYATRKIRISTSATSAIATGQKGGTSGLLEINVLTERSAALDNQIVKINSAVNFYQACEVDNAIIENILGESFHLNAQGKLENGDEFLSQGFSSDLRQFYNACSALCTQPTSYPHKLEFVAQSENLVQRTAEIYGRIQEESKNLNLKIQEDVEAIRNILGTIAQQNKQILDFEKSNYGDKAIELRENRQINLESLANYIDFTTEEIGSTLSIKTNNVTLLEGRFIPNELKWDATAEKLKAGTQDLVAKEGSLAGHIHTKTTYLPKVQASLSNWVEKFSQTINNAYQSTFFSGTFENLKLNITADTLSTSLDPNNAQLNSRILAILNTKNKPVPTLNNLTPEDSYRSFITEIANDIKTNQNRLENENLVQKMLVKQRENRIGVSIDSQIVSMIQSQKAFQASARVISVIDELMDQVINMVRH